jgi:hypothetical protein
VVELEAQAQQQAAFEDARGKPTVARLAAHRAEQDRVVVADLGEDRVRQHLSGGQVSLGPQVVGGLLDLDRGGHLEHLQRLGGDLRSDAVAADHGHPDRGGRGVLGRLGAHVGRLVGGGSVRAP